MKVAYDAKNAGDQPGLRLSPNSKVTTNPEQGTLT
jgi:hypothetical protein